MDSGDGQDPVERSLKAASIGILRGLEEKAWQPAIRRLRRSAAVLFWLKIGLILGGAVISTVGGGMDGSLLVGTTTGTTVALKGILVIAGAICVFVGGVITLVVEDDYPQMLNTARELSQTAREHLNGRDKLAADLSHLQAHADKIDKKRRERLAAIENMCEVVEAALLSGADTASATNSMLRLAIHAIHKAVDYEGEDFFTITIFRREDRGDGERMHGIARDWTDPVKGALDERSWPAGKGYTGVAWARAKTNPGATVVIPDTTKAHIREEFPVDNYDPAIEALYQSVAAVPILIGSDDDVWGVVTATFDRPGVFKRDESALSTQNVEVVRDVARFAGLLAGLDRLREPREAPAPPKGRRNPRRN